MRGDLLPVTIFSLLKPSLPNRLHAILLVVDSENSYHPSRQGN